ncbi:MAG: hypothetical protein AAF639_29450 [Chloroflexota bacterium]
MIKEMSQEERLAESAQKIYIAHNRRKRQLMQKHGLSMNGFDKDDLFDPNRSNDDLELDDVEQAVLLMNRMNSDDWNRFLELLPNFQRFVASRMSYEEYLAAQPKPEAERKATLEWVNQQLKEHMRDVTVDTNQPFLHGFTFDEFIALPDEEQDAIWTALEAQYWHEEHGDEEDEEEDEADIVGPYSRVTLPELLHLKHFA